ncbi:hypothetical protein BHE74_00048335, partial [Ensete ventricosum]
VLKGVAGAVLAKSHNLASAFAGAKQCTDCSLRLILHSVKDKERFEAHAPYLIEAFDRGTKATQLAKAKLGSEGLSTGQEDVKV